MLGRIILIALQFAAAFFAAPQVMRYIPVFGDPGQIVQGLVCGVIVWVVGLVGSQALKDVGMPSPATLAWALVGGAIGGALIVFKVPAMIGASTGFNIVPTFIPPALAVLGYALKK